MIFEGDTLPGCFSCYGRPWEPNGPCETCKCASNCLDYTELPEIEHHMWVYICDDWIDGWTLVKKEES